MQYHSLHIEINTDVVLYEFSQKNFNFKVNSHCNRSIYIYFLIYGIQHMIGFHFIILRFLI